MGYRCAAKNNVGLLEIGCWGFGSFIMLMVFYLLQYNLPCYRMECRYLQKIAQLQVDLTKKEGRDKSFYKMEEEKKIKDMNFSQNFFLAYFIIRRFAKTLSLNYGIEIQGEFTRS